MSEPVCFLDMDGVPVDFWAGALALHGRSVPYAEREWDIAGQLDIPAPAFYGPMDRTFWANLPWMPDGRKLLGAVEAIFGNNIAIMTSPIQTAGCIDGKIDWIKANAPQYSRRFAVCPAKHLMAGPGKILLDDHDDNIDRFLGAGGRAVLVPRPWNRRRRKALDPGFTTLDLAGEIAREADLAREAVACLS